MNKTALRIIAYVLLAISATITLHSFTALWWYALLNSPAPWLAHSNMEILVMMSMTTATAAFLLAAFILSELT